MSDAAGHLIASGSMADVFARGSRVLKLYKRPERKVMAFREAALHAGIEAMRLPVPTLWGVEQVDERWGIVFTRIRGLSFAERMHAASERRPEYIECMVRLQLRIHQQSAADF